MIVKKSTRTSLETGRVDQKLRTRDRLVSAAAEMLRESRDFSVGDVADRAQVGRTTAYRYFPTLPQLMAHAALWKLALIENGEFEHIFDRKSAFDIVDSLVTASHRSTHDHEDEYRTMLRLSLERTESSSVPARGAFRRDALMRALHSVEKELGRERFERVVSALCMMVGIEALVVMQDICLLEPARAREVKRWAAKVILQAAMEEARREMPKQPGRLKQTETRKKKI
jgi:AcrR family transcriptional regulator